MPLTTMARVDGKVELTLDGDHVTHVLTLSECRQIIDHLSRAIAKTETYLECDCKCKYMPGRRATGEQRCECKERNDRSGSHQNECPYTTDGARRYCPDFIP